MLTEETKVDWSCWSSCKQLPAQTKYRVYIVQENVQSCLHNNMIIAVLWIPELAGTIAGFSKEGGAGPVDTLYVKTKNVV